MFRFPVMAALVVGSTLCLAKGLRAQGACNLIQSRSAVVRPTSNGFFNFISQPVVGCGGGVVIRADSAVLEDASGYTRFIGNFEYRDSTAFMSADRADHFAAEDRLIGVGNVYIVDGATGATFEGDSTVLIGSGSRREDGEITILGRDGRRAHALILVSPRAGAPDAPEASSDSAEAEGDAPEVTDSTEAEGDAPEVADSTEAEGDAPGVADSTEAEDDAPGVADSTEAEGDATEVADSTEAEGDAPEVADSTEAERDATGVDDSAAAAEAGVDAPIPVDSTQVTPEAVDRGHESPPDTMPVPYDVDAERIHLRGAGYMMATGSAELRNDDFRALADSIEYLEADGRLLLRGAAPRVLGYGGDYVLSGDAVDLDMDGNQVAARGDAALAGSQIDLTAPEIRVLMSGGVLDRVVAMNEQPPETEPPGLPGDADTPSEDSSAAVLAAEGEAPGDSTTRDTAGEVGVEEGATQVARVEADVPSESARGVPGEEGLLVRPPALGETGDPATAPGEVGDSTAAAPPARPRALAETFELEGDSIDVLAPGEVLERVIAVGDARGESRARDSLNTEDTPEIARSDWVSGDTIIAVFTPAPADASPEAGADTVAARPSEGYQLDHLIARGRAASLYRMTPSGGGGGEGEDVADASPQPSAEEGNVEEEVSGESVREPATGEVPDAEEPTDVASEGEEAGEPEPDHRLALHYVRGDLITIFMRDGEVTSVVVEGDARGVQLEPVATSAPPRDTATPPPSTRR